MFLTQNSNLVYGYVVISNGSIEITPDSFIAVEKGIKFVMRKMLIVRKIKVDFIS